MPSTKKSNKKKRRRAPDTSTYREESATANNNRSRSTVAVTMAVAEPIITFESLVNDTHDTILQFLGKRSYRIYGGINKRCREVFLSKNIPKETFVCGYAPLSLIKQKFNYSLIDYDNVLGQAIVAYNRKDILKWLLRKGNELGAIRETFNVAAGVSLKTFQRIKNDVGDDFFTSKKIKDHWDVTYEAACGARLDVLKWLKDEGWFKPYDVRSSGMETVAKKGNIPVLEWLLENGCSLDRSVFDAAAEGGNLNMLEFLKGRNCPLHPKYCMYGAAKGGSLETIEWLLQNGCSFEDVEKDEINGAASKGHLHVIKFFIENNGFSVNDIDKYASHEAARGGHLHVLKWLNENNRPIDEETFEYAVLNGNLEAMKWLYYDVLDRPSLNDTEIFAYAAGNGRIENLQWLLDINCPWDNISYYKGAQADNDLEVLEWLKEKGCPRGDSVLPFVDPRFCDVEPVTEEAKRWLRENGFTLENEDY